MAVVAAKTQVTAGTRVLASAPSTLHCVANEHAINVAQHAAMNQHTLWIGNRTRNEFARITDSLEKQSIVSYADLDLDGLRKGQAQPQLICVAIARPGEFGARTKSMLERLKQRYPTSPIRLLLGESCCGMKRTCDELKGHSPAYVHEVPTQGAFCWLLDRITGDSDVPIVNVVDHKAGALAVVYSASNDHRQAIAQSLTLLGIRTIEMDPDDRVPVQGVDFVVWEVKDGYDSLPNARWIARRHPEAEIVVLMSYPREYELAHLAAQGVRVVAQPYRLSNLFSIFGHSRQVRATSAA